MLTRTERGTHSVRLRSGSSKQSQRLDVSRCRDVSLVLTVPISRGRTVIFDILEYIVMEWTMPKEHQICLLDIKEGVYPKKKKSVADQFTSVKYRPETIVGLKN